MAECIEREATIKRIQEVYCADCNSYNGVRCRACGTGDAIGVIEDAPAADVVPVVHGKWIESVSFNVGFWVCSNCKFVSEAIAAHKLYGYCPNCGARMDGVVDNA